VNIVQRSAYHAAKDLHAQMARMLALALALSLLAAVGVQQWISREALRAFAVQSALDHGRRIAAALERSGVGASRRDALLQSYFDELSLQRLELIEPGGTVLFRRALPPSGMGGALVALDRLLHPDGLAVEVALRPQAGRVEGARLRLECQAVDGGDLLWRGSLQFAAGLGVVLLFVLAWLYWKLKPMRRQVSELGKRIAKKHLALSGATTLAPDFASVPAPLPAPAPAPAPVPQPAAVPTTPESAAEEVRRRSAKSSAQKARLKQLESDLRARGEELEALRREAHLDPLTGLSRRQHFMARLESALEGTAVPSCALMLLRVRELAGVNQRVGHARANQVLKALAKVLQDAVDGQSGSGPACGRLNGSDFALLLPVDGTVERLADRVLEEVRRAWAPLDPEGGLAIAVTALQGPVVVAQAMSNLDEALSRAEADVSFSVEVAGTVTDRAPLGGAEWQQRLADALAHTRAALAEYPVCEANGKLLHLDCPMRVQLDAGGPFESAWRWLAPAVRGRYCAQLDLLALQLALDAITGDLQPRCINLSAQSLESSAFIAAVTRELQAHPAAAKLLWIDVPEALAADWPAVVVEASRQWRPLGAHLALEHAGERLGRIEQLDLLGLDCIRVDSSYLRGLTGPESVKGRRHLQSIVRLVKEAGLLITAEGVSSAGDLSIVWALGFDAATGPAVQLRRQSMLPQ
jgi:GGDEF domain-containing protein/EAL domain-containing protein (putative c-di-GMP-specific phosphodiesterase class I)